MSWLSVLWHKQKADLQQKVVTLIFAELRKIVAQTSTTVDDIALDHLEDLAREHGLGGKVVDAVKP